MLHRQWQAGTRAREQALHLLFLSWYSCSEPVNLSGLEGVASSEAFIDELFGFLGGEEAQDAEVMFTVAVMAEVAPWCLGSEQRWDESLIASGRVSRAVCPRRKSSPEGVDTESISPTKRVFIAMPPNNRE